MKWGSTFQQRLSTSFFPKSKEEIEVDSMIQELRIVLMQGKSQSQLSIIYSNGVQGEHTIKLHS